MALAINVRADNNSASEIERLWDQVVAFEVEPSMRALGYRPHFTFAIYDSPAIDEKIAWAAMLAAVAGEAQFRIEFKRIRWFAGSPLVLWAEPSSNEVLTRIHSSVSAAIDPAHCHPHYRPGYGRRIVRSACASPMSGVMTRLLLRDRLIEAWKCCSTSLIALPFRRFR
ncbi:hypothetical protein ACQ5SK_12050 [Bradyrhizobium japonicum]